MLNVHSNGVPAFSGQLRNVIRLKAVAHAYNPGTQGAEVGGSLEARSLRAAWPKWQNAVFIKIHKLARHVGACCNPSYSEAET